MVVLKINIKRFILISIAFAVVCACNQTERSGNSSSVKSAKAQMYYVSLNGNDLGNGSKRHPFATIERARKAVQSSVKSERKIEVVIGEGTYYLDKTIEFYPEDSGTELAPVTWRAAEGEKVVLSGGRLLDGQWQEGNEGIWFLDLPPGRAWKRNINSAEAYEQMPGGSWNFRQLFVDGKRAIRARYPNADEENPFLYASGGSLNHIELAPGQIRQEWGGEEDAQINIVSNWRFFNQRNDVTEVDVPNSTISIGPRERHGKVIEGNWFWIEGVKSELDQSREWYLDTKQGRLYYKPKEGKDPNDQIIIAPYLNRIVYLKGDVENGTHVKYVNFKGLEFRHTSYTLGHMEARVHTDGAVMFENATNCRIDSCHFENIGGYALWLHLDDRS